MYTCSSVYPLHMCNIVEADNCRHILLLGGHYFVTGGTDHMVRVYNMYPTPTPEPWELHGHTVSQ